MDPFFAMYPSNTCPGAAQETTACLSDCGTMRYAGRIMSYKAKASPQKPGQPKQPETALSWCAALQQLKLQSTSHDLELEYRSSLLCILQWWRLKLTLCLRRESAL